VQLTDQPEVQTEPQAQPRDETPLETLAGYCMVLVVGLFAFTFLGQNFLIPSGSMKDTLLVGDHLLVDRITTAPPARWMPLMHYREPQRGDITVFYKPVADMVDGEPQVQYLVKRLIGVPGDHIRLHDGVVIINGVAQSLPPDGMETPVFGEWKEFLDEFPSRTPEPQPGSYITEAWAVDFASHVVNGELVVPPGMYFMMGDNRHNSADSRFWGFVPRENIVGRPLVNYWSFVTPDDQENKTSMADNLAWMAHVVTHFISDTRWKRTFHRTR
jgi:signal peptidase I